MTVRLQTSPYLPRQRNFPNESPQVLGIELDKAYIDIASRVNERTIGLFAQGNQIITGENWFLNGQPKKQQTLRQVYPVTSTNPIPHGINLSQINGFTRAYGQFTDGTNWYGLFFAGSVAIAGQLTFYLTDSQIVIVPGAGAPAVNSGLIVLEWLSTVATNT